MSDTREMSPGDRRELRSLVKKQFQVLRNDVKRREKELEGEIETELARRYRGQDERVQQAQREFATAKRDFERRCDEIVKSLQDADSGVHAYIGHNGVATRDEHRTQTRRALLASIPQQISDAMTRLDQQELNLLRELTVGALDTAQAQQFIGDIPTVADLVPKARLAELEAGAS